MHGAGGIGPHTIMLRRAPTSKYGPGDQVIIIVTGCLLLILFFFLMHLQFCFMLSVTIHFMY